MLNLILCAPLIALFAIDRSWRLIACDHCNYRNEWKMEKLLIEIYN